MGQIDPSSSPEPRFAIAIPMCCPESIAIICPVIEGESRINLTAEATSSGNTRRFSGIAAHSSANAFAALCVHKTLVAPDKFVDQITEHNEERMVNVE